MAIRRPLSKWLFLFGVLLAAGGSATAKDSTLTPAKIKQIRKTRKSYETCRKDAVKQLKLGSITKKRFEVELNTCKENFPGADLYITCKKQAIRAAKAKNVSEAPAVEECKHYLTATEYDPENPLPFFVEAGQIYFAGIGLNHSLPVSALNPPNFECDKLQMVARNPANAQYLLFGNHPRVFAGVSDFHGPQLMKVLKLEKPEPKGFDTPGFGRIFGDPRTASGAVFFPAGSCDFNAELGDIYAGLSAYYLLDTAGSAVSPYFGIAYYKGDQTTITTAKLIQQVAKALGPSFQMYPKNNLVTFIAAAKVSETDDEKDPKNLCRSPRQHRFVAVVEGRKENPLRPEYVLLANVKDLCDFGDRLGKRLTE